MLDKLKFWKHKEEPLDLGGDGFGALGDEKMPGGEPGGLGPLPGEAGGLPSGPERLPGEGGLPSEPGRLPGEGGPELPPLEEPGVEGDLPPEARAAHSRPPVQVEQPMQQPQVAPGQLGQMEVISAKLDAIRASLDSVNIRLERIEQSTTHGKTENKQWYKES